MDTLLTILTYYTLGAIGFFMVMTMMEVLITVAKGPEYAAWLMENERFLESRKERSTIKKIGVWFIAWIPVCVLWLYCGFKGKTFLQAFIEQQIKNEEKKKAKDQALAVAISKLKQAGAIDGLLWLTVDLSEQKPGVVSYLMCVPHGSMPMIAHLVLVTPEAISVYRSGTLFGSLRPPAKEPDLKARDLSEAILWAETDMVWLSLCKPGRARERLKFLTGKDVEEDVEEE